MQDLRNVYICCHLCYHYAYSKFGIEHNCFQAYIESNFNTVVYGIVRGDIAVDINMCIKYDLQWQLSPLY